MSAADTSAPNGGNCRKQPVRTVEPSVFFYSLDDADTAPVWLCEGVHDLILLSRLAPTVRHALALSLSNPSHLWRGTHGPTRRNLQVPSSPIWQKNSFSWAWVWMRSK